MARNGLLYGSARLTADIDVTVRLGDVGIDVLVEALERQGFDLRINDPDFVARTRVLPIVHTRTGVPADVVLAGPGLEDLFLSRAAEKDVAGVRVPVVSLEDLVVMKILAGREKDKEDVRAVLRNRKTVVDTSAVRRTLRMLEEALGQSDLSPLLEELVSQAARRR